jgi:hypothetical protein
MATCFLAANGRNFHLGIILTHKGSHLLFFLSSSALPSCNSTTKVPKVSNHKNEIKDMTLRKRFIYVVKVFIFQYI